MKPRFCAAALALFLAPATAFAWGRAARATPSRGTPATSSGATGHQTPAHSGHASGAAALSARPSHPGAKPSMDRERADNLRLQLDILRSFRY
jgi:hypothetical protein